MKRAVLLHGTDGSPTYNWFPWLQKQLEDRGYTVLAPLLPGNHTPNRFKYEEFLRSIDWDFSDNLLVGHSSGATTALNLLASDWFPKVRRTILIGTLLNENMLFGVDWYQAGQFDQLFPIEFDTKKIKEKSDDFVVIHGYNDPYCSYGEAANLSRNLAGELVSVPGGLHLSSNRTELPEILPFV